MAEQINIKALLNTTQVEGSLTEMKQKFAELEDVLGSNLLSPQETQQVLTRMGQIKGEITSLETQIDSLSSTNAFDELVTLTTPLVGAITAVGSATQLLGVENEKFNEIIQRTTQLTIGLSSLREIADAKAIKNIFLRRAAQLKAYTIDKLSFNLTKEQTAANVAQAASQAKVTKATRIATKAQLLWNKAIKSNPILIIVAAVAALTTGIILLSKKLGDNTDELDENAKAIDGVYIENEKLRESYNENIRELELLNLEYLNLTGRLSDYEFNLKKVNIETERQLELARQQRKEQLDQVYEDSMGLWEELQIGFTSLWKGYAKAVADVTINSFKESADEREEIERVFQKRVEKIEQERQNTLLRIEEERLAEINRQKEKQLRRDKERHKERMEMLNERYDKIQGELEELDKTINDLSDELEIKVSLSDTIWNLLDFSSIEDQMNNVFTGGFDYQAKLFEDLNKNLKIIDNRIVERLKEINDLKEEYRQTDVQNERERIEETIRLKQEEVNKLNELDRLLNKQYIKNVADGYEEFEKVNREYLLSYLEISEEISRERLNTLIRNEENLQGNLTQISLREAKERHKEELEILKNAIENQYKLRIRSLELQGGRIAKKQAQLLKKQLENELDGIDEEFNNRFDSIQDSVRNSIAELGGIIGDTLGDVFSRDISNKFDMLNYRLQEQVEKSKEDLDSLRNEDLISEQEYNDRMEKMEEESNREELRLKREQARAEKRLALFQIAIDTAVGIAKSYSQGGGLFGAPLSAIVAAQGALQAALVASQKLPEFEMGGYVEGGSHEVGGVPVELEGKEYVIRKDVVQQPGMRSLLDSINSSPVDRSPYTKDNNFMEELKETIRSVTSIPVVNVESEYTGVQRKVKSIETRSTF